MTRRALWALFALLIGAQAAFALTHRGDRPGLVHLPPPPTPLALSAMAMGDDQTLYRALLLDLFLSGDGGGRVQPLMTFDYQRVAGWLRALGPLAPRSHLLPAMAALYYGLTPDHDDLRQMVMVLLDRGRRDPSLNWRWLAQATFLARHRLDDLPLALEIAHVAAQARGPGVPLWVRQLPAFVLAAMGQDEAARMLIKSILDSETNISPAELRFMQMFIAGGYFAPRDKTGAGK